MNLNIYFCLVTTIKQPTGKFLVFSWTNSETTSNFNSI